jgi:hypothetical protein
MNKPFWLFILTILAFALGTFSIVQTRRVQERDATIRDLTRMAHDYERLVDGMFGGETIDADRLSRVANDFDISDLGTAQNPGYLLLPKQQVSPALPAYQGLELRLTPDGQLRDVALHKP